MGRAVLAVLTLTALGVLAVLAFESGALAGPGVGVGGGARETLALGGRLDAAGIAHIEAGMDRPMLALAARFDPTPRIDAWDRPAAWTPLDLIRPAGLQVSAITPEEAMKLNALLPVADVDETAAQPFVLQAVAPERERAVLCMTQAIYYEAALEPLAGQQAVAQTILNRVRHPDFPKSVCGVVYQGSQQVTGCQFSFTCDGSRDRPPIEPYWSRARAVAEAALSGFVQPAVGTATHYHADYVFPRWGPQMVKIGQIGQHIFYRFPGPIGQLQALTGRYDGRELAVSMAGPSADAILAAKAAGAATDAPVTDPIVIASAAAPNSPTDLTPRAAGQVVFGRRIPSKDEIAKINAQIADLTGDTPPPAKAAAAGPVS